MSDTDRYSDEPISTRTLISEILHGTQIALREPASPLVATILRLVRENCYELLSRPEVTLEITTHASCPLSDALDETLRRIVEHGFIVSETSLPEMVELEDGRTAQVFIKAAIFDEDLMRRKPYTGGLLCRDST